MRSPFGLALLFLSLAAPAAKPAANLDDEFLAAREAYRAGQATKVAAYAKRFQGHILEPYLAYWLLSPRLEQASPARTSS
jgi:soluble lytic murein transglycosylase